MGTAAATLPSSVANAPLPRQDTPSATVPGGRIGGSKCIDMLFFGGVEVPYSQPASCARLRRPLRVVSSESNSSASAGLACASLRLM